MTTPADMFEARLTTLFESCIAAIDDEARMAEILSLMRAALAQIRPTAAQALLIAHWLLVNLEQFEGLPFVFSIAAISKLGSPSGHADIEYMLVPRKESEEPS
jgi:hypothetical protein